MKEERNKWPVRKEWWPSPATSGSSRFMSIHQPKEVGTQGENNFGGGPSTRG